MHSKIVRKYKIPKIFGNLELIVTFRTRPAGVIIIPNAGVHAHTFRQEGTKKRLYSLHGSSIIVTGSRHAAVYTGDPDLRSYQRSRNKKRRDMFTIEYSKFSISRK